MNVFDLILCRFCAHSGHADAQYATSHKSQVYSSCFVSKSSYVIKYYCSPIPISVVYY